MKKGKFYLLLGNFTFHHFGEEELKLFKNPEAEHKALVHEIDSISVYDNEEMAEEMGEEALINNADSYLILGTFNGEIAFEQPKDELKVKRTIKKNGAVNNPNEKRFDYIIVNSDNEWMSTGRQATEKELQDDLKMMLGILQAENLTVFRAEKMEMKDY